MFTRQLATNNPSVILVEPNPNRDAPLAVGWLAGEAGRHTLAMMGVAPAGNHDTTLEAEERRVLDFLMLRDQYNWMISADGKVVGAVWADLKPAHGMRAPAVSIMIGDPSARGKGIGRAAMQAVLDFLWQQGHRTVFARHRIENGASQAMLHGLGFRTDGDPYTDPEDGFTWQNVVNKDRS